MTRRNKEGVHAPTENAHFGLALAVIASAQLMIVLDSSLTNRLRVLKIWVFDT